MGRAGRIAFGALLAAGALLSVARAESEISPQKLRRASSLAARGTKALTLGNWTEAERRFRAALEAVPIYPDAHLGLGQLAMRDGDFERALASFEQAREGYVRMRGHVFAERMKNYEEAQRRLAPLRARLEQVRQMQGRPSSDTAEVALQTARLEQEIVHLEQVRPPTEEEIPGVPVELHFFVGNAQMRLGRVDEAIASWEAAVGADPGFAPVYNNLAIAHARQGRPAEALDCLERARRLGLEIPPGLRDEIERLARDSAQRP